MLRRFNVKNFMSFSSSEDGKTEEFSMIPGRVRNLKNHIYDCGGNRLLKFAAIYGANAAGKSNIVKAISCMKSILLKNSTTGYFDSYSKIGGGNDKNTSYFEAEIVLSGKRYSYGFEVVLSQSRFVSEWLVELNNDNTEKILFERDIINSESSFSSEWMVSPELKTRLEIYLEEASTDSTALFLHTINRQKQKFYESFPEVLILQTIYNYFESSLVINSPDRPVYGRSFSTTFNKINKSISILNSYGTGVTGFSKVKLSIKELPQKLPSDIKVELLREFEKQIAIVSTNKMLLNENESELSSIKNELDNKIISPDLKEKIEKLKQKDELIKKQQKEIKENCICIRTDKSFFVICIEEDGKGSIGNKVYEIKLKHFDDNLFDYGEESDGTQRLWDILEVLLADKDKTFIIDEIDRCLHPVLTYKFIKDYIRLSDNKNVQLIVTTHESRLLDFDLLRRDEIWFVEKRQTGESDIYSLEEYNERFDKKIDKAYLEGRYGGVPVFTTLFPVEDDAK